MNNLILFVNAFLSYLLVFVVVVAVVAIAVFIGITLRKKSNEKAALMENEKGENPTAAK